MSSTELHHIERLNKPLPYAFDLLLERGFRTDSFNLLVPELLNTVAMTQNIAGLEEDILAFLQTQLKLNDEDSMYDPFFQDIARRSFAIGVALHQGNNAPVVNGKDKKFRKSEIDPRTGQNRMYVEHALDCAQAYMENGRDALGVALGFLHDTVEDTVVTSQGQALKDEALIQALAIEFPELPELPVLLRALTIPDIQPDQKEIILNSRLAATVKKMGNFDIDKPEERADLEYRTVKMAAQLAHIFLTCRHSTTDLYTYLRRLRFCLCFKAIDASKNMESGKIKKPSSIRNRILIHFARIYGWDFADHMLQQLISLDSNDPFNPGEKYLDLGAQLRSYKTIEKCARLYYYLNAMGISSEVLPRQQLPLGDEDSRMHGLQYHIQVVHPEQFEQACSAIQQIPEQNKVFRRRKNRQHFDVGMNHGVVHSAMRYFGRQSCMFTVEDDGQPRAHIRVTAGPAPVKSFYLPQLKDEIYPEDFLFSLPEDATLEHALDAINRLLHADGSDLDFFLSQ